MNLTVTLIPGIRNYARRALDVAAALWGSSEIWMPPVKANIAKPKESPDNGGGGNSADMRPKRQANGAW